MVARALLMVVSLAERRVLSELAVDTAAAMLVEARVLLLRGWSQGAQARDERGQSVQAWSQEASSWSLLGSLLATWYQHNEALEDDFVAHSMDARALGDAMAALGTATGSADLDGWNDSVGRSLADILGAVDGALESLPD
jgi:hypothetical protein